MRILQVPPYAPPMEGGSERYCFNLSKKLLSKGHDVEIYTSQFPRDTPAYQVIEGVPVTRFFCHAYMLQVNPLCFFWKKLLDRIDEIDLVHAHSYIYFLANQTAVVRLLRRFPFILHLHGGLGYIPPSLMGYKAAMMKIFYDRTVGPFTMKTADRLIACCETDRMMAVEKFGVDADRVITIYNPVEVDSFSMSKHGNPCNVVFIGRLTALKGGHHIPTILKELWERHGDSVRFTIVGDGQLRVWMRDKTQGLPITFTGVIPNHRVPGILRNAGVLILPSFLEGFPLVNIEALASGVPVVSYDVGGCSEIVDDGRTGFLIPAGDRDSFVDRVSYLIENSDERRRMGRVGRRIVEERHSWKTALGKIEKVYEEVSIYG